MAGLKQICKLYGGIVINGKRYVWDYAEDKAVPEDEMPPGSERHRRSEQAKWQKLIDESTRCWSICDD